MMPFPLLLLAATADRCEVRSGLDQAALERARIGMMQAGLGLLDLSVRDGGDGRPRFTAVWSSRAPLSTGTDGAHGQEAFYHASLAAMRDNYRMTGITVGMVAGAPWFQAIYRPGRTRQQSVEYWIGAAALKQRLKRPGLVALAISPYRIGRWQYFAALFETGGARDGRAAIDLSGTAFARRDEQARRDGLSLADVHAYRTHGKHRFVAVWRPAATIFDRRCRAWDAEE